MPKSKETAEAKPSKKPKVDPLKSFFRFMAKHNFEEARRYSPGHPTNVNRAKLAELANLAADSIDGPEPGHYFHPISVGNFKVKKKKVSAAEYRDPNPEEIEVADDGEE